MKDMISNIFPPIAVDYLKSYRWDIQYRKFKAILERNSSWNNRFFGEQVIVLANGPSLNTVDTKLLEGKKVIVMNSFEKAEWKSKVDIIAHCIGEPYGSAGWSEPSFLESIDGTDSHSYWLHFSSYGKLLQMNKSNLVHYVFPTYEPTTWGHRKFSLNCKTLSYQTTAQLAIQVAFYMGFKKIYLLGFDHDWLASPDYSKHFYSDKRDPMDVLIDFTYFDIINFMRRMWQIYFAIEASATAHDIKIYNLSQGSFLDVFDFLPLEVLSEIQN